MKSKLLVFLVALFLFIIPFFWLKPNEMDLGGDSSRLFFYDPISYLKSFPLYSIAPSGTGVEIDSYFLIPYIFILYILKSFLGSPYLLITLFNSFALLTAFLSIYKIAYLLLITEVRNKNNDNVLLFTCLLTGLFYVFSPILTPNGWDKALTAHNVFFLNPLIFLLLLQYVQTKKIRYSFLFLITTFIFAPNFSPAPSLFSFMLFALFYLFLYSLFIQKSLPRMRDILLSIFLFFLLHSFHIVPQIMSIFKPTSYLNAGVFSETAKFVRGLSYFISTAQTTKLSNNILSLPQGNMQNIFYSIWVIFPIILVMGLMFNATSSFGRKHKFNYLLLTSVFLLIMFFITANITDVGFNLYKLLFNIPGFSMFRNYVGQFSHVYTFFYSILLSYSLFYIFYSLTKFKRNLIFILLFLIILITAIPFIRGDMANLILNPGSKTPMRVPIIMDPEYEKVLSYIRNDSIDGKILSFPFTDSGIQMVSGLKGGAYQGPSTISYLTGKTDFAGYDGLNPFGDFFLNLVYKRDIEGLKNMFSMFNIKYIFYNSDTNIYDDIFPDSPYSFAREYMPTDQQGYKIFLSLLPIEKKIDFGDKYHIYKVFDDIYLPHIYTPTKLIYTNNAFTFPLLMKINDNRRVAVLDIKDLQSNTNEQYFYANNISPYTFLKNNYHFHSHSPYVAQKLDSILYPFTAWKEKDDIKKQQNNPEEYRDKSLLYLTKRVAEIDIFKTDMSTLMHPWKEPSLFDLYKTDNYISWESELTRYKTGMIILMHWNESLAQPEEKIMSNKLIIFEQLQQHQTHIMTSIKFSNKNDKDKKYLSQLTKDTFDELFDTLHVATLSSIIKFRLNIPKNYEGEYEVYITNKDIQPDQTQNIRMTNGDKVIKVKNFNSNFIQLENIMVDKNINPIFTLTYPVVNLVENQTWNSYANLQEDSAQETIHISNELNNNSGGLVKGIPNWAPDRQYLITFDYLTYGDDFTYKFYDKKKIKNMLSNANLYFDKNLNSTQWKTQQTLITSSKDSYEAYLQIIGNSSNPTGEISLKNLKIVEIKDYELVLKKVNTNNVSVKPPIISYTKINPTKYKVKVSNAKDAYALVLSEGYDPYWKVYTDAAKSNNSIDKRILRILGFLGKDITGLFLSDKTEKSKNATYFNNDITEEKHTNTFISSSTFESWGMPSIADAKHFQTNGYANIWIIDPKEVSNKGSYELIIEHETQKNFYLLFTVSLLTFIAISISSVVIFIKFKRDV